MSVRFRVNERIGKCNLPLFAKIELKRRQGSLSLFAKQSGKSGVYGFVFAVTRKSQKWQFGRKIVVCRSKYIKTRAQNKIFIEIAHIYGIMLSTRKTRRLLWA